MRINAIFRAAKRWFSDTPEEALEQAYQAALTVKAIEDRYFNGQKPAAETSDYSNNVATYFQAEIKKYLKIAVRGLTEFKASRSFLVDVNNRTLGKPHNAQETLLLEKIRFVESVILKYDEHNGVTSNLAPKAVEQSRIGASQDEGINQRFEGNSSSLSRVNKPPNQPSRTANQETNTETISDKTGVLPRSFLRTFNRIKREIDPNSYETEEEVLSRFRSSRNKTAVSIKFFLILIIAPLLTHQVTKSFIVSPLVDSYFSHHEQVIFINTNLEEEAFIELQRFEESLRFRSLLGLAPALSEAESEAEIQAKALEIAEDFRYRSSDAIENIFADIFSLVAFATIIFTSKREISIVKSFIDEVVYGLSDSAKAFLIILVTDMFVGYHSPHGWEVILEGIAKHFGLPENREFDFLFIATFPVILDTVLKYWIFRYLNRISPSAVATYRNMNE